MWIAALFDTLTDASVNFEEVGESVRFRPSSGARRKHLTKPLAGLMSGVFHYGSSRLGAKQLFVAGPLDGIEKEPDNT